MSPQQSEVLVKLHTPQSRLSRKINRINKRFWRKQSELLYRRIADPVLFSNATSRMSSEVLRGVPLKNQMSLELALEQAENERLHLQQTEPGYETAVRDAHRELSRKGGKAPKRNRLTDLICRLATRNLNITERTLLHSLKREIGKDVILSIDSESALLKGDVRKIHFMDRDGRTKSVPVSGLKHRLSRTKSKIKSR